MKRVKNEIANEVIQIMLVRECNLKRIQQVTIYF